MNIELYTCMYNNDDNKNKNENLVTQNTVPIIYKSFKRFLKR